MRCASVCLGVAWVERGYVDERIGFWGLTILWEQRECWTYVCVVAMVWVVSVV